MSVRPLIILPILEGTDESRDPYHEAIEISLVLVIAY